jgi:hypothetical protein
MDVGCVEEGCDFKWNFQSVLINGFLTVTKYLSKTSWFQSSVHHGEEGMVEQRSSFHGSQETEKKNASANKLSPFLLHLGSQSMGWCCHHSRLVEDFN